MWRLTLRSSISRPRRCHPKNSSTTAICYEVRPFDREAVAAGLKKIGAEVLTSSDEPGVLRFLDNNRIMVELKPLQFDLMRRET